MRLPDREDTVKSREEREPESEDIIELVIFRDHEREATSDVLTIICHERVPIEVFMVTMAPERLFMLPERAFCARKSVK